MAYDQLRLENQLCFPLYACSRAITRAYGPMLEESGLTYTQYITMMALWEYGTSSVRELGEHLHLDSGTLTPLLKKLEERGLLTRKRATDDERRLEVELTDLGRALEDKVADVPAKMACCINLTPEEGMQFAQLLYKVIEGLKE